MKKCVHKFRNDRPMNPQTLCGAIAVLGKDDRYDASTDAKDVTCWRCIHLLCSRPLPSEPKTPEHNRLHKAKKTDDATQLVGEFFEWLEGEKRMVLGQWGGDRGDFLMPVGANRNKLLAEFFGVSEEALESEKRAILDHQRALNEAIAWAKTEGRRNLRGC